MIAAAHAALADPALPWPGFQGDPARAYIDRRASVAKHLYMFGAPARWKTPIAWRYNDIGRPPSRDTTYLPSAPGNDRTWISFRPVSFVA